LKQNYACRVWPTIDTVFHTSLLFPVIYILKIYYTTMKLNVLSLSKWQIFNTLAIEYIIKVIMTVSLTCSWDQ